jgi:hypothetical protein
MVIVWLAWFLYTSKTIRFVEALLARPDHLFLQKLRILPERRRYILLFWMQALLLLPMSAYAMIVAGVACHLHRNGSAIGILAYIAALGLGSAWRLHHRLMHPARIKQGVADLTRRRVIPYWLILYRFLLAEHKALFAGVKLFGCAILYLLLRDQNPSEHDIRMPLLVFSLAIFAHGPLLYKCRQMENTQMRCYRAMPVPLLRRFAYIAVFCGLLLLPEMLTLGWLTPHPIRVLDALLFLGSGYSLLLLLCCLLSTVNRSTGDFLKLCLVLFGILYGGVLGDFLIALSGFFFFTAAMLFFGRYWRYEAR